MKHLWRMFLLLLAGLLAVSPALASAPATPNQRLSFRTGPNTKYVELYTLPQSTAITAIEYESGNGTTWVLVEYTYEGQVNRAYTGLKRMTVNGNIPWASHLNQAAVLAAGATALAAPSAQGARRADLSAGTSVTLLRWEGGFAFIEFYDDAGGAPSRGWIPASAVSGGNSGGQSGTWNGGNSGGQSGTWNGGNSSGQSNTWNGGNSSGQSNTWNGGNSGGQSGTWNGGNAGNQSGCVNQRGSESVFWSLYPDYSTITGGTVPGGTAYADTAMAARLAAAGTVRFQAPAGGGPVPLFAEADGQAAQLATLCEGCTVEVAGYWRNWYLCVWSAGAEGVSAGWARADRLRRL